MQLQMHVGRSSTVKWWYISTVSICGFAEKQDLSKCLCVYEISTVESCVETRAMAQVALLLSAANIV